MRVSLLLGDAKLPRAFKKFRYYFIIVLHFAYNLPERTGEKAVPADRTGAYAIADTISGTFNAALPHPEPDAPAEVYTPLYQRRMPRQSSPSPQRAVRAKRSGRAGDATAIGRRPPPRRTGARHTAFGDGRYDKIARPVLSCIEPVRTAAVRPLPAAAPYRHVRRQKPDCTAYAFPPPKAYYISIFASSLNILSSSCGSARGKFWASRPSFS